MLTTLSKVTTFIYLGHFGLNLSKVKERNQQQSEYRQLFDDISAFRLVIMNQATSQVHTHPTTRPQRMTHPLYVVDFFL